MPKNTQCNKVEKQLRTTYCTKLYLRWYETNEIYKFFEEKFKLWTRQTDRYIKLAKVAICDENEYTIRQEINVHYRKLIDLYNASYKKKDFWVCNKILKSISDLRWLDEAKKIKLEWDLFDKLIINVIKNGDQHDKDIWGEQSNWKEDSNK